MIYSGGLIKINSASAGNTSGGSVKPVHSAASAVYTPCHPVSNYSQPSNYLADINSNKAQSSVFVPHGLSYEQTYRN